jgi:hypothetical protein
MDLGQGQARFLVAVAFLLLTGAAEQRQLPIRESRWLKTPDLVGDLTRQPVECIAWPKSAKARQSVEIGRALFRSPLLLGGQAARTGLSCASCHRNGRTNPHFHFPGISGEPGTADVTASLMSEKRGDDIFNPKPIPDLGGERKKLKVVGTPKLRTFVHGLIAEEFTGPEPSPASLDAVVAYVSALSPAACKGAATVPITLASKLSDVDAAVALAATAYASGDEVTGRALLAAARSTLGAIDERFQLPGLEPSRQQLKDASAELFGLQEGHNQVLWAKWKRDWPQRRRALLSAERRSLYNPDVIRKLLAQS